MPYVSKKKEGTTLGLPYREDIITKLILGERRRRIGSRILNSQGSERAGYADGMKAARDGIRRLDTCGINVLY